ncbi:MAG: hypothetical protein M1839_008536 [Geoglossum umbratile]|nr:MAG: hypothetical protein M1839_008536 [Geoglossum umbratile]
MTTPDGATVGSPSFTVAGGLAYAVQQHNFTYTGSGYPGLDIGHFKRTPPIQQGFTNSVGYSFDGFPPASRYGGPPVEIPYMATHYRGSLFAKVGPEAAEGYEKENAFLIGDFSEPRSITGKYYLIQGTLTPIRILAINGQFGAIFEFSITDPDGNEILGKVPNSSSGSFLQFPTFPPFGEEA